MKLGCLWNLIHSWFCFLIDVLLNYKTLGYKKYNKAMLMNLEELCISSYGFLYSISVSSYKAKVL